MTSQRAAIDSGPLIALFDKSDQFHARSLNFIKEFKGQLFTTVAVLTEVSHLLDFSKEAQQAFLRWVADGAINIVDLQQRELYEIIVLTKKYGDVPMDFADASLMVISESLQLSHIASIDSDFYIYRKMNGNYLKNIIPDLIQ